MQLNIEDLAGLIAQKLTVPVTMRFWGKEEIANALGVSISSVEKMSLRPDFPTSYRLPSTGKGAGSRRWKATDVMSWMETLKGRSVQ